MAVAGIYVILHVLDNNLHLLNISEHVKQIAWTVFLIAGTFLLYIYFGTWAKRKPGISGKTMLTSGQTKQIKVLDYGANRIGDIDKLLFEQDGEKIWLHFPPHTAKYIMQLAAKNGQARVGFLITQKRAADNFPLYDLISIEGNGNSFVVQDIPPPPPANGKQIELTGTIVNYKKDESGNVSGFIIGNYIIEIPKHIQQNIVPILLQANTIIVKGYERDSDGFVNTTGFVLIKPYAITIDKTNYLL